MKTKLRNGKIKLYSMVLVGLLSLIPWIGNAESEYQLTISPESLSVPSSGGEFGVTITIANFQGWTTPSFIAMPIDSWISSDDPYPYFSNGCFSFFVKIAPNTGSARESCISFKIGTNSSIGLWVSQEGSGTSSVISKPIFNSKVKIFVWHSPVPLC